MKKVSQSVLRNSGATLGTGGAVLAAGAGAPDFGPGAGDAPGFGPGAGCGALATAPAGDGLVATPAAAAWPLGLGAFDFSLAIANSSLSDRKRTDTRSGTAAICPFKSI